MAEKGVSPHGLPDRYRDGETCGDLSEAIVTKNGTAQLRVGDVG
jgi:hypothetical protein